LFWALPSARAVRCNLFGFVSLSAVKGPSPKPKRIFAAITNAKDSRRNLTNSLSKREKIQYQL
jgi:hypothetical protein